MLTVLIATRNRSLILRDLLKSYCGLQPPSGGWKLVIVDNGSTDETLEIIESFANRLPLQSLLEPKLGKNNALNAALPLVEGDLTVFTDDDAFPHSDWLVQLRKAADAHSDCAIFGGKVLPRWEAPPPHWIQWAENGPVFTLTAPSLAEGLIDPNYVFGPNMAVRTDAFRAGLTLDPSVGPAGADYAMGSETELLLRLGRLGKKAWHSPDAVVEHLIRREQMTKDWIWRRGIRFGRGQFRLYRSQDTPAESSAHLFVVFGRRIAKQFILVVAATVLFREEDLFRARWRLNYLRGQWIEARALPRTKRAARSDG